MTVTWTEPTATDNSGMTSTVTQSHQPGDSFNVGTTTVTYTFTDMAGNQAQCSFSVTLGNYILRIIINCSRCSLVVFWLIMSKVGTSLVGPSSVISLICT